jgi:hypothetical protein
MFDVLEVVVQMVLNIALPAWLIRWDERRLSELQLSRAWPPASFWIAVVAFGPLCLPFHFVRTRRSLLGLVWGILAFAVALSGLLLAGIVLGALGPE